MKNVLKNPRIMVFLITGLALLVAIITSSIAWFSASGSNHVTTSALRLSAEENSSLSLTVPDLAAEYERYMGETGTEYDGPDYPYLVEYSPFILDFSEKENMSNKYLTYYFDPATSYIQRVIAGSDPIAFTSDDLWDNFVMNLVELEPRMDGDDPVLDENDEPIYDPTGVVYYGENGYFRNSTNHTLFHPNEGKNYFSLEIYFQGDVGCHLLNTTEADIDEKYAFAYSNEIYMFAKFHLSAVFNLLTLHDLHLFGGSAYDGDYNEIDDHWVYFDESKALVGISVAFTGFSMQQADGSVAVYRIPELYDADDVDYAYYFKDWFVSHTEEDVTSYYIYRATKANGTADNVVTLSLRPLRGENEHLYPSWGDSYVLTLGNLDDIDEGEEEYVTEYYVRPKGEYYSSAGYLTYAPASGNVAVNNPRGGLVGADNVTGTGMGVSHTIPAPTREGYRFLGWSTTLYEEPFAADADLTGVSYLFTSGNSYRYNFGATGNGHDLNLYAVWQELGVNVTVVIDSVWGHNYATVAADHITYNGVDYDLDDTFVSALHRYSVTIEVPKHTDLSTITVPGAVATIGGIERNLTLRTWNYLEGGIYYANTDYPLDIEEDVTIYAMWNERAERTVTLDVNMYSSAALYNYGTIEVVNPINVEHYTVLIDNNYQGTFSDEDRHDITVKMLEGMTLADANLTVKWHRQGAGMGTNSFEGWYTNVGSKENDMATTSWSTLNYSATKYNTSTAITADIKLWVRFN